jgi:RNA 2',3'-cyclic 3'-phosphodiesterase
MYNMPDHACFPGFERRVAHDRLFFGLLSRANSSMEISKAADGLRRLHGLNGRLIEPERLHVSLHAIGQYDGLPNFIIERAYEAAAMVRLHHFP